MGVNGLEVIDKGATTAAHPVPLLFVHGAWHAAWCWDEYFLDHFAALGFRATAVSLRGHGGSVPHPRPRSCAMTHYIAGVTAVADHVGDPIVIGHSLGGAVVQKYLEARRAPAGVLLASMPVNGVRGFTMRMWRHHPARALRTTVTGKSLHSLGTPERAREMLYSAATSDTDVARHVARMCEELNGRVTLESLGLSRLHPRRVTSPVLVLAAERDRCFTVAEEQKTARAYGTEAVVFPGMGHNMMLEPDWQAVADRIVDWLEVRGM